MNGHIFPEIVPGNFHDAMIRGLPGASCGALATGHHDAFRADEDIFRSMPLRYIVVEGIGRCNTQHQRPGTLAHLFDGVGRGHGYPPK